MPGRQILTVTGAGELRRLASDCRTAGNQQAINAELRRELIVVGRQGAAAVRASVRATPSMGQSARRGRPSLRGKIAKATEAKVRNSKRPGVIVWVNPGRMPGGEETLPAYYDGTLKPWRHRTFGSWSGKKAVVQQPHPYFNRAINPIAGQLADAGDKVLDRIADKIEEG